MTIFAPPLLPAITCHLTASPEATEPRPCLETSGTISQEAFPSLSFSQVSVTGWKAEQEKWLPPLLLIPHQPRPSHRGALSLKSVNSIPISVWSARHLQPSVESTVSLGRGRAGSGYKMELWTGLPNKHGFWHPYPCPRGSDGQYLSCSQVGNHHCTH